MNTLLNVLTFIIVSAIVFLPANCIAGFVISRLLSGYRFCSKRVGVLYERHSMSQRLWLGGWMATEHSLNVREFLRGHALYRARFTKEGANTIDVRYEDPRVCLDRNVQCNDPALLLDHLEYVMATISLLPAKKYNIEMCKATALQALGITQEHLDVIVGVAKASLTERGTTSSLPDALQWLADNWGASGECDGVKQKKTADTYKLWASIVKHSLRRDSVDEYSSRLLTAKDLQSVMLTAMWQGLSRAYIPVVGMALALLGLVLMYTAPQIALGLVYGSPASAGFGEYAAQITSGHPVLIYVRLYVDLWFTHVVGGLIWLCVTVIMPYIYSFVKRRVGYVEFDSADSGK